MRRFALPFLLLAVIGVAAACSAPVSGPMGPPQPGCAQPQCLQLSGGKQSIVLPPVNGIAVTMHLVGHGTVFAGDSSAPFAADTTTRPLIYTIVTAVNGSAILSDIPGFTLTFRRPPLGTIRRAVEEDGAWKSVGSPGIVYGNQVSFPDIKIHPTIHLAPGNSYRELIYSGGILPSPSPSPSPTPKPTHSPTPTPSPKPTHSPTPSPSPSPTPGALSVSVTCNQSADACSSGTTTMAGSVQFTALNDTATLTPAQSGSTTFTLRSDTCNKTDDPSAGGNWVTFSPAAGQSGTAFTATAQNAGTTNDPSTCIAVIAGAGGQTVTIDLQVTLGSVVIGERRNFRRHIPPRAVMGAGI